MADRLAKQGFSHPLIGLVPALGISAEFAKGVIRGWTSTKHKQYRQFVCGQRQAKGCLKNTRLEGLGNNPIEQKPTKNNDVNCNI